MYSLPGSLDVWIMPRGVSPTQVISDDHHNVGRGGAPGKGEEEEAWWENEQHGGKLKLDPLCFCFARIGTPYIREVKSNWSYINCCAHKAILSWLSFSSKWWVFDIRHPLVRNNVASAKRHQKMASAGQLLLCGENFTRKSPNEFRPQVNFVQTSAGGLKPQQRVSKTAFYMYCNR